jgi:hypothetical protein
MWQNASTETHEQSLQLVQQEVSRAISLSVEAVTREPLPEEMVLLLLRLALAETLRSSVEREVRIETSLAFSFAG